MQLCELAGDYSFLYTTAPRDRTQGRRWRPEAQTPFEVVLPWPSYGKGQHATALPTHLQLEDMWLLTPCPLRPDAKDFLLRWLKTSPDALCGEDLSARVLRRLRAAGFAGCGEIVELESGYFFPHESLRDTEVKVAIATGVRTTFGAVALGLVRRVSLFEIYGVGVFVGRIRGEGAPINVA